MAVLNVAIALVAVAFGFWFDRERVLPRGDDFGLFGTMWTDYAPADSWYHYVRLQYRNANGRLGMSAIYGALQRLGHGSTPLTFPWWFIVALGTFGLAAGLANFGTVITKAVSERRLLVVFLLALAALLLNPTLWGWSRWPTTAISYFFPFWLLSCVAVMESPHAKRRVWMTIVGSILFVVTATTSEQLLVPTFLVAAALIVSGIDPWKSKALHLARVFALSGIAAAIYKFSPGGNKRLQTLKLETTLAERIRIWLTNPIEQVAKTLTASENAPVTAFLVAVAILAVLFIARKPSLRLCAAVAGCVALIYGSTINLLFSPYAPAYSFFFATVFAAMAIALLLARVLADLNAVARYGLVIVALVAWGAVSLPRIRRTIEHDVNLRTAKERAYGEIAALHRSTKETRFLVEEIPLEFDEDWGPANYFHWLGIKGLDVALCTRATSEPISRKSVSGYANANLRTAGIRGPVVEPARVFSYLGDPPLMRGVSARDYVIAFNPQSADFPILELSMITLPDIASSSGYRAVIRKRITFAPRYDQATQSFVLAPVILASEDLFAAERPMTVKLSWVTPGGVKDAIPVADLPVRADGTPRIDASYPLLRIEVGGYGPGWVGTVERATLTRL